MPKQKTIRFSRGIPAFALSSLVACCLQECDEVEGLTPEQIIGGFIVAMHRRSDNAVYRECIRRWLKELDDHRLADALGLVKWVTHTIRRHRYLREQALLTEFYFPDSTKSEADMRSSISNLGRNKPEKMEWLNSLFRDPNQQKDLELVTIFYPKETQKKGSHVRKSTDLERDVRDLRNWGRKQLSGLTQEQGKLAAKITNGIRAICASGEWADAPHAAKIDQPRRGE